MWPYNVMMDAFTRKKATVELHVSISFPACSSISSHNGPFTSKQTKIDGQERQSKIIDIVKEIVDIDWRITYKQRRIDTAAATKTSKLVMNSHKKFQNSSHRNVN